MRTGMQPIPIFCESKPVTDCISECGGLRLHSMGHGNRYSESTQCREESVETSESIAQSRRPIPLTLVLLAVLMVHLPLLLMKLPLRPTTPISISFSRRITFITGSTHGIRSGTRASRRPRILRLPQQWVALSRHVFGLDFAYMAIQLVAILLLAVGVYRFSLLWVSPRAASFAALASVFLGSESFLVYSAGQLGTTSAAPIYLNALPFLYEWIRVGKWRAFIKASALFAAAAAAHHATLLFGSFFFALPVVALAVMDRHEGQKSSTAAVIARTIGIVVLVSALIGAVLLPFLDCAASLSRDADADPASEPRELHPQSAMGSQLLCRSLRRVDACASVHLLAGLGRRPGCDRCCWASGSPSWLGSAEPRPLATFCWGAHLKC